MRDVRLLELRAAGLVRQPAEAVDDEEQDLGVVGDGEFAEQFEIHGPQCITVGRERQRCASIVCDRVGCQRPATVAGTSLGSQRLLRSARSAVLRACRHEPEAGGPAATRARRSPARRRRRGTSTRRPSARVSSRSWLATSRIASLTIRSAYDITPTVVERAHRAAAASIAARRLDQQRQHEQRQAERRRAGAPATASSARTSGR